MRKFLFIFVGLVTLAAGVGFFLNWQRNIYSKEGLKLEILSKAEVNAGEAIEYIVKYKNNGSFRLENPELIFEPPEGAVSDGKFFPRQILSSEKIGEAIYPGQEQSLSFKMRLLGQEGQVRTARATLSYQPKDLKAKYESSTSFTTLIKLVPFTFEFDLPTKIETGKNFNFRINYFSNIDYPLPKLRIQAEYPSSFEFVSASPKAIEKTDWEIPVLNRSQGGRIEVQGKLSGQVGQAENFKAKVGVWLEGEFISLKETAKGVEIIKPSIYLRQEINKNPQYAAFPGDWLHYEVYFKNIGDDVLTDLFMVNKLEGEAFDLTTLKSDSGNFQAGDNSVVFDWRRVSKLQYLIPNEEGRVDFWVKLKDDLGNIQTPIVKNKIFVSQVEETFTTKIGSKLEIVQKGYFQDEIFGNAGPFPPRAGESTTYTVVWQAKNYYSDVKNVKVEAVLPQGVELTGKIFPEDQSSRFSFDSKSREIVWLAGDMSSGTGVSNPAPNIAFQIIFIPGFYQRGQTPEIIGRANIQGEDIWAESIVGSVALAVNALGVVQ